MTGVYKIAGQVVSITTDHALTHKRCANWRSEETPQISVTVTQEDLVQKRRFLILSGDKTAYSDAYLESIVCQEKVAQALVPFDCLPFHASALCMNGQGIAFSGPSGTGKSTHARLWRERFGDRVRMVNDDHPFLRLSDHGVVLCGSPWMGKHHIGENIEVPLKAIVFLHQGASNRIEPVSAPEVFGALLKQSIIPFDEASRLHVMQMLVKLTEQMELFRMECNMEIQAAEVSCAAVIKGELL